MTRYAICLSLLLAGPAYSQQINVRSGAHEAFARLVLDAPPGIGWSLEESPTGAKLTLEGHTDGFDTSAVFERIDKSFIESVSSDASSVSLEFSCTCRAAASSENSGMIVLDVSASQTIPSEDFNGLALIFVGNNALRFEQNEETASIKETQTGEPAITPVSDPLSVETLDGTPQLPIVQLIDPSANADRLGEARDRITRQIGTAATRGILNPIRSPIASQFGSSEPQIDTGVFGVPHDDISSAAPSVAAQSNIRVSTSNILPSTKKRAMSASISDGITCISPQRLRIRDWGSEAAPSEQISSLRSQLYGEFDELNTEVALELAHTYLYFGFGAEALQTLLLNRNLRVGNPELLGMAEILEYGHSPSSEYLSRFMECEGDAALWAILSARDIDPTESMNVTAALRSASALPLHLRKILVPELSKRLLAYGDAESASTALRSLERAPKGLSADANLAKADVELAQKKIEKAQDRLAEIVTSNTEQSAAALIKFVDSHLAEDSEIDENVATLVEAYAQEMRNDPLEVELRRTHVLALGKSGQFSAAFDALNRMRARNIELEEDTLRSSILDLLTRNSDDIKFLHHAFKQIEIAPESLTPISRFQLAKRLTDLGFFEQAKVVLESGLGYSDQETVALLRAEIYLSLEKPAEALAHLFGLDSERASRLRARAEASAGDFSSAHEIYSELGNGTETQSMAWLSQDWSDRVDDETPVFGQMVSVAQIALEAQVESEGMLERTATQITESRNARSMIQKLLNSEELQAPEIE